MTQALLSMNESLPFGMLSRMKTQGERIKHLRNSLGLTQAQFADRLGGITRGAVGNWERNLGIKTENLALLSETFSTSFEWLASGRGAPPATDHAEKRDERPPSRGNASLPVQNPITPKRMVPVFGKAVGGTDGRFLLNGEKVGEVFAPTNLEHVPEAYSVYVHGHSMEPRYMPGEGVWVHPHRPVKAGDYVVVQLRPETDGEAPYGYVKRYVSFAGNELVLEQHNPAAGEDRLMRFPRDQVLSIHRIVGSYDP